MENTVPRDILYSMLLWQPVIYDAFSLFSNPSNAGCPVISCAQHHTYMSQKILFPSLKFLIF